ncbi:MAG: HugZ family protein [Blastocatellia bacterium]
MNDQNKALAIRRLLEQERHGVLSTISLKCDGWPFGSVTPYALSAAGTPLILVSGLAEHTRNLVADPRVSLFVQDTSRLSNPQAAARVTLLGRATPVAEEGIETAATLYLARFPEAGQMFQLGDFRLFSVQPWQARYIGGFGEMFWARPEDLSRPT